jgi:hypothetical protein
VAKRAINLSKMEVADLVQLRDEIETALNGKIVIERDELQTRMDALTALVGKASNGDGQVARGKIAGRRRGRQSAKAKVHALARGLRGLVALEAMWTLLAVCCDGIFLPLYARARRCRKELLSCSRGRLYRLTCLRPEYISPTRDHRPVNV